MTTGKTIALTRHTFVGKVMSLLFNMLSRLVITFLPKSKHFLISWLQSPSAVILEPPKIIIQFIKGLNRTTTIKKTKNRGRKNSLLLLPNYLSWDIDFLLPSD
ncbi:unnamed protein product [Rangifer tarandus platyrhynchus]|uniref:Uncharacterized protein n=1 Tax=Rangifer tarandus platyrhynchus TaxID=3082113 RepID=A0ABN8XVQ6_RANTA|nr:unnamed protein product [Rangifer tarandus platyrhynchus]